jgi:pimeloyl-ACP methyl ester carboxylesterase
MREPVVVASGFRRTMWVIALAGLCLAVPGRAQEPQLLLSPDPDSTPFLLFLQQRPVGREQVAVIRNADGWIVRGASQMGTPVDLTTSRAEIRYTSDWEPRSVIVDSLARGRELKLRTTFADGKASSEVTADGKTEPKVDQVSADAIVLLNTFLGSYAALAQRLAGVQPGAELRGYVAPQIELPVRVQSVTPERIETPRQSIDAVRYLLSIVNPPPAPALDVTIWADQGGQLLRLSVPAQGVELAREDIASAASRTTTFAIAGDASVSIPAAGFNIAATITRPAGAAGPFPAIVLIGGSGYTDRDETVFGIPVFGQLAKGLVEAGFVVVRYDKRGVGQSGGRAESATLADYAEDARAIVRWLERQADVDRNRIAVVGHSEGAAVAMILASREDRRVKAAALVAGMGTTGAELILEQQRHALDLMKMDETERAAKIALQEKIHAAAIKGTGWDDIPEVLRRSADTPWFVSFLTFDPARVMRDVDQPLLIVQGELDTQVPPHHAEKLEALARSRKRKVDVSVLKVPGVNHLLVPAKTGEVSEYGTLGGAKAEISPAVPAGIGSWLAKTLGAAK